MSVALGGWGGDEMGEGDQVPDREMGGVWGKWLIHRAMSLYHIRFSRELALNSPWSEMEDYSLEPKVKLSLSEHQ